jgi:RHS repeat-associated protein
LNDQHPGRHRLRDHRRARLNDRAHQRRYSGTTPVATDYVTTDALGSTIGLINGTSTSPVRDYSYDPDGNATSTGSGATTDIRYAGGQALSAGLYHYGARYYNPGTARWTQPDPINQISSLTEANRYAYVGGDPINAVDPTGLACADPTGVLCRLSNTVDDIIHKTPGKAAKWGCISSGAKGFASKAFPALKVSPWVTGGCVVYGVVKGIESE